MLTSALNTSLFDRIIRILKDKVKNEDDNAQVKANESNSKYTVIDGITIKDIFKYEARFSASDEFDELW